MEFHAWHLVATDGSEYWGVDDFPTDGMKANCVLLELQLPRERHCHALEVPQGAKALLIKRNQIDYQLGVGIIAKRHCYLLGVENGPIQTIWPKEKLWKRILHWLRLR